MKSTQPLIKTKKADFQNLINFLSKLVLHPNPNGSRRIIDCFLAAPCQHKAQALSIWSCFHRTARRSKRKCRCKNLLDHLVLSRVDSITCNTLKFFGVDYLNEILEAKDSPLSQSFMDGGRSW